jgi:hypothetical protein
MLANAASSSGKYPTDASLQWTPFSSDPVSLAFCKILGIGKFEKMVWMNLT